jgi:DNA-binding transcriptional regulator YiaG
MKRKIQKSIVYNGLGFPIKLKNVPMVEIDGEYLMDINLNELQKVVLWMLCHKEIPLTGNEVSFVRKYFSMTTTTFGELFAVTSPAVLKWEKHGNKLALITPTTEQAIRLKILELVDSKPIEFKNLCESIALIRLAKYQEEKREMEYKPMSIDAQELYVA